MANKRKTCVCCLARHIAAGNRVLSINGTLQVLHANSGNVMSSGGTGEMRGWCWDPDLQLGLGRGKGKEVTRGGGASRGAGREWWWQLWGRLPVSGDGRRRGRGRGMGSGDPSLIFPLPLHGYGG